MNTLPTTEHVQAFLRVHMETSAYDAAHSQENGHGPLGQRYSLWQSCIDHLELLGSDADYARHFGDLVMRRAAAGRDGQAVADVEAQLHEHGFSGSSPEAAETGRKVAHVMELVSRIRPRVRHLPASWWDIEETRASVLLDVDEPSEIRAVLDSLCRLLGLHFQVKHHTPGKVKVAAEGVIDDITMSFWRIVAADEPTADPAFRFAPGARPTIARPSQKACAKATAAFKLAARLQKQVPAGCYWFVHSDIDVMLRDNGDITAMRAELAAIAARFGLDYTDTPRPDYSPSARTLCARGTFDGVPVEFWTICEDYASVPAPVDDDGGALNDTGRDVAEEAAQRASTEREGQEELAAWEHELLASATDPTPESAAEAERLSATLAADAAAEEEHFAEVDAQFADCAAGDDQAAAAEGWYSPSAMEYFPDAGSIPTAEELAEEEPTYRALTVGEIQAMFRAIDAAAEARSEADL